MALPTQIRRAAVCPHRSVSYRKTEDEGWLREGISGANLTRLKVDDKEEVKLVGKGEGETSIDTPLRPRRLELEPHSTAYDITAYTSTTDTTKMATADPFDAAL